MARRLNGQELRQRTHFQQWLLYHYHREYKDRGRVAAEMATDLGVSRGTLSAMLTGHRRTGYDIAHRLADLCERTVDDLGRHAPPRVFPSLTPRRGTSTGP